MTLAIVAALAAAAVVLAPPLVKVMDREAGWPLAALFAAAAVAIGTKSTQIFSGTPETLSLTWVRNFVGTGADVTFSLRADALSAFFALLALVIGAVVFVYSAAYLPKKEGNTSFYTIMTAFTASILLLVLADDVVVLFIGWELVSIASFLLIARSGSSGQAGSMRTLVLTFIGGLTLAVALMVSASQAGSTNLQEILASDIWSQRPGLTALVAVLIAVSAFTKSAQLPFHFWLPEAMAAATPVSAFLHAAAVVKAGIYLLLRFSTIFHDVAVWNWLLISVGIVTAVVASLFAIQKTDLKKLTAYSTVSHLGWIVAVIGVGTPVALAAAVVHTLAHALFKSSLFMLIGVVDHETGTRDIRRLPSIWKKMPFTFASALVGCLSMAAVPPLFGFVSKEFMLTAFQDAPIGNIGVIVLMSLASIGALLTFTYTAKFLIGGFIDPERPIEDNPGKKGKKKKRQAKTDIHEAPISLWLPAALPGLFSLPVGLFVFLLDKPVDAVVASTGQTAETHLALWHGINLPLIISVAVIVLGLLGIRVRRRIWATLEREILPFSGNSVLNQVQSGATALGRLLGKQADSLSPSRHIVWPIVCVIALMLVTLFATSGVDGVALAPRTYGLDNWQDIVPMLIIIGGVIGVTVTRHRMSAAVFIGVVGVGVTIQMLVIGAPDVALTQFLVEALVVVIFMMVVRYQPKHFAPVAKRTQLRALIVALLAGFAAFLGTFTLLGRRGRSDLANWFLINGPEVTGGDNLVGEIIVQIRALDTLGELSVLAIAALVIVSVAASIPRMPFTKGTRPNPLGQSQLNSLPLKKAFSLIAPVLIVLTVLIFLRGSTVTGGGFPAALVAATIIMFFYLSRGRDTIVFTPETPIWFTGIGVAVASAAGFVGYAQGSFLEPLHFHILDNHFTTALIFDGGIFLAVLGMITSAINTLGGYLKPGVGTIEELDYSRSGGPLPDTPAPLLPKDSQLADPFPEPLNPRPGNTRTLPQGLTVSSVHLATSDAEDEKEQP